MTGLPPTPRDSAPRVLLLYHRNPTTTAAYLETALRGLARVTTAGDGQEVHLPRGVPISIPALLAKFGEPFQLVLEVEGENVDTHDHDQVDVPCAWWAIDSHLHTSYDAHFFRAKRFDHVFVAQKHHVVRYQDWAWVPSSWLPLAADPSVFRPFDRPRRFDVGFVGNVLPGLHDARQRLLGRLLRRFDRVLVARGAFREDAARELASCRAVFNRSLHEDVNMRVFETLACGRPLLTDRLPPKCGLEDLVTDGQHAILYDDARLEESLERCLRDEARLEEIARAGRAHLLANHTYEHRAAQILRVLGIQAGQARRVDHCWGLVMIVAHEVQQLGLGGTEKTMLLLLRHLRALGVEQLHAFAPRARETDRAEQVAEVAELHLYDDLDELARDLRALRPHVLHRHRSGYADALDGVELDPRTRIVETNVYGDHGSRADLRLFVSRTVAQEQDWPEPIEVLYNPCEPPVREVAVPRTHRRFAGVDERDVERVLVFGRVGRPSAHIYDPIALEAYARVESPWTRYVALAPPPNMVEHARWSELETFVALPPTTSDRELSRFYSLIDVLAHARRDGETCGMNIQEAMLHGLPVITHLSDTHNAQPEVLGEGYPWIAARGDRDAYTRFMEEAVASPARRAELGERNRRRAEAEFDARRITERLLGHYRRLVGEQASTAT